MTISITVTENEAGYAVQAEAEGIGAGSQAGTLDEAILLAVQRLQQRTVNV
jgi:hypothetical protein